MGVKRNAVKCLDCGTTVEPVGKWEQCDCGHLYVDTSGPVTKVGFLDESSVEEVGDGSTRRRKPRKSNDQWTESGTFE